MAPVGQSDYLLNKGIYTFLSACYIRQNINRIGLEVCNTYLWQMPSDSFAYHKISPTEQLVHPRKMFLILFALVAAEPFNRTGSWACTIR